MSSCLKLFLFKNVIIGIGRIKAVRCPIRSYIVRVEQNGLYNLSCGRWKKFSRKMTIELLKKMGITKIIVSTNCEIALQKPKLQKQIWLFPTGICRLWDRLEFYMAVKKRSRPARYSLPDSDRGRLQGKSGWSIEIWNPWLHSQTFIQ